ncbi:DUF1674 domain-containing protein [Brevundimonas sp.]|uniref:DUF1674 domain-containing protein n=1 Tax=Brevundimonas sp. TaxID=1871086 RepID=UPI000DB6BB96|nr:MAG: DUF1674 domain-containing protein [Brevundimonas sp.]
MTEQPTPAPQPTEAQGAHGPAFNTDVPHATPERPLSETARRALLEAAARRAAEPTPEAQPEHGGPRGPEPTRYGDWEKKGLAVDF